MRKVITFVITILFCVTLCSCAQEDPLSALSTLDYSSFSLEDYEIAIKTFPTDRNVGKIATTEEAVAAAKQVWEEEYGEMNGKPYDIYADSTLKILYDESAKCWHVWLEYNRPDALWSAPHTIINENGDVLALWLG